METVKFDFIKVVSGGLITNNSNTLEEINVATKGLKASSIFLLSKSLGWEQKVIAKTIGTTTRTLERHVKDRKPLGINLSQNALEVARLSSTGISYFGDVKRWNEWLNTAHTQFDGKAPKDFLHTIRGRELIKRIINGLEYGFTA